MKKRDRDERIKKARSKASKMTSDERELQRRSFAYGNGAIENIAVTRASVDEAAERIARMKPKKS